MEPLGPAAAAPNDLLFDSSDDEMVQVHVLHPFFKPDLLIVTLTQSQTLQGKLLNSVNYMPEHFVYFRTNDKVDII